MDEISRTEALQNIRKHQLHAAWVTEELEHAQSRAVNRSDRRAIRRARKVLKAVRRTGLANILPDDD